MTENCKLDSMLKHAKLKQKKTSKLLLCSYSKAPLVPQRGCNVLHYAPQYERISISFPQSIRCWCKQNRLYHCGNHSKCDPDKDNTYGQEALPALRSHDSKVSIAQLRSPAPSSCSCPWWVSQWKPVVPIRRHSQGGQRSDKVWRKKKKKNRWLHGPLKCFSWLI